MADGESVSSQTYTIVNNEINEPIVPQKTGYTGKWEYYVLTTGELAKYIQPSNLKTKHFDNKKNLADFIKNNLPEGSNILLKASRFMKFEEIIEELKN